MKPYRFLAAALLAAVCVTATAFAGDPTGTWKWTISGRNGQAMESTLKLDLKDGKLTGTVMNRMGETPITDATFADDQIAFSVTRERNGNRFTSQYRGKLSGDTITGQVQLPAWGGPGGGGAAPGGGGGGGGPRTIDWVASRAK